MCGYEDLRGRTFNSWDADSLKAEVDSGPVYIALHILNVVRHLFLLTMVINEHKDQDVISDYRGGNYGQRCPWRTSALFLSFLGAKSYNYVINPLYSCSPVYFHLIGSRDYHINTSVYNIIVIC